MTPNRQHTRHEPGGLREYLSVAYPLVISNAALSVMHFVDRLFLSWAGRDEIAASLPAGIMVFTFLAFFLGVSEYTNTFVAQYFGAKQYGKIGLATWQGIWFSAVSGALSLVLLPLGHLIFESSGHPPQIVEYEKSYFSIVYAGGVFYILNGALSAFYSGRGKTYVIMAVSVFANLVNGFLDYALIFGVWGFPQWGIRGAAAATLIATALMSAVYLVLFLSPANQRDFQTRSSCRFDRDLTKRLIRFGAPSGAQFLLDIGSFTVFIFLIGRLGAVELAASNIVISINMLSFFPMTGAGIAAAALVGQYIGRKDYATAEKCAYTALIAVEAYMLILGSIYLLFPESLIEFFRGDAADAGVPFDRIVEYGTTILIFVAIYQISDGMLITFSGALRGAGDTAFAMWASIVFAWCFFVPGTWVTLNVLELGVVAAWIWATIYLLVIGFIFLWRFRSGYWKKIRVIDSPAAAEGLEYSG